MPTTTICCTRPPLDAAAEHRERHAIIRLLDSDAIASVPLDIGRALRLAMLASEMRAVLAQAGAA